MSELSKILLVLNTLAGGDQSLIGLQSALGGASPAAVKRYLAEARHMGAIVETIGGGTGNPWRYRLANWPEICARVGAWTVLESSRSLTGPI